MVYAQHITLTPPVSSLVLSYNHIISAVKSMNIYQYDT